MERREVVGVINSLWDELCELPGGYDEAVRLAAETGCGGPDAPLGAMRALRTRLEGALLRMRL